jgi:hypothetical protein
MRRAGKTEVKSRGSRRYSRTPLTTYYRNDTSAGQSPFQNRQPKRNRRKYLFGAADIVLIIVLLAVLVYSLLLSANPKVTATDNSYRSDQDYAKHIKTDFSGLGSRNKITFNEARIVKRIEGQFPEVSNASVELPFFSQRPAVRLLISPPAFKLKSHGRFYVVDLQGMVVSAAGSSPRFAKLATVADESGFVAQVGKPVLSSQAAAFINTVVTQSRDAKVPLKSLTLPSVPLEMDVRTADQPYFVKFFLNGDANLETGQFLASRQKFISSHVTPSQYLDVRVAGKVFYK